MPARAGLRALVSLSPNPYTRKYGLYTKKRTQRRVSTKMGGTMRALRKLVLAFITQCLNNEPQGQNTKQKDYYKSK